MLGNIYEKRLGAYVAQVGGVDKLLYQGRKVTLTSSIGTNQEIDRMQLNW